MFYPILFSIAGFLSGGVLYSYHVPKLLCGVDVVADSPDHNPGMTNAMKLCGVPVGLLCLALDMAKGFLPVFAALRFLRIEDPWLAPVLAAPALGHALAVFYPFAGGKAVAVSFGVLLGLLPQSAAVVALIVPYLFFSTIVVIRPDERRTVVSFFCMAMLCLAGAVFVTGRMGIALGASIVAVTAMWKNRARNPGGQCAPGPCPRRGGDSPARLCSKRGGRRQPSPSLVVCVRAAVEEPQRGTPAGRACAPRSSPRRGAHLCSRRGDGVSRPPLLSSASARR